jgi:hypothetical protein
MRNFTLPRGPCNFLDLRISPWEIPFLLLLSISLLPGTLSFSPHRRHLSLAPSLSTPAAPLSPPPGSEQWQAERALGSAARGGSRAARSGSACGRKRGGARVGAAAARRGRGRLWRLGAGAAWELDGRRASAGAGQERSRGGAGAGGLELQCGGCGRIRTGALEPRVGNVGGR